MLDIIVCLFASFSIAYVLVPEIINIAHNYQIHDLPDDRKIHSQKVPRFGGVAIFFGFIITTLLLSLLRDYIINVHLMVALLFVVIVGFRDDFIPLKPRYKLAGQLIAALIVIYTDIRIVSLHGFMGIYELSEPVSYLLSIFSIIVITNAFNLIDGIDGLAGTLGLIIIGFYGTWFYLAGNTGLALLSFSIIGATVAFLFFNFRTVIFMGDTGSLMLGFVTAVLTIQFLSGHSVASASDWFCFENPLIVAACVISVPLFDTLRVFVNRTMAGRSPFSPDKGHIHHLLINIHPSHARATGLIALANLSIIGAGMAVQALNVNLFAIVGIALAWSITYGVKQLSIRVVANKVSDTVPQSDTVTYSTPRKKLQPVEVVGE